MTRSQTLRVVNADPASVALLLAGPTAYELWPADDGDEVRVTPPLRSGLDFASSFTVVADGVAVGGGRLVVSSTGRAGAAELRLVVSAATDPAVIAKAERYLDRLVRAAESRSSAA